MLFVGGSSVGFQRKHTLFNGGLVAKSWPTLETPWPVVFSVMGFSGQEYWSGLPFTSSGDLPDLGIEPGSPALQADSLPTELGGTEGPLPS